MLLWSAFLLLAAEAWAADGVYPVGVVRADGTRTTGSAVQLSAGLLLGTCRTLRRADRIVNLPANRPFRARLGVLDGDLAAGLDSDTGVQGR